MGAGFAIGLAIGAGMGLTVFDDLVVGLIFGAGIGLAYDLALKNR